MTKYERIDHLEIRYQIVRLILSNSCLLEDKLAQYQKYPSNFCEYYTKLNNLDSSDDLAELLQIVPSNLPPEIRQSISTITKKDNNVKIEVLRQNLLETEKDTLLKKATALQRRQRSCC